MADIGVGAAVGGIVIFCGIEPLCSGSEVCTDAGRGTGVEEEGGVVFVGSNSANVFYAQKVKVTDAV